MLSICAGAAAVAVAAASIAAVVVRHVGVVVMVGGTDMREAVGG